MNIRTFGFGACVLLFALLKTVSAHADSPLLTPAENLWLQSRNDTIVVFPEQNNPPYSYQTPAGVIEGLSVDYIELIAQKIGATVQYLTPRSRTQIFDDVAAGKGDVILSVTPTADREQSLIFTESYITVPFVIVMRKDVASKSSTTLADYTGKRVAVTEGSAIESYIRKNYPRVVIEDVTDNEAALQEVVLGQVDSAVMDVASLSYLLSKQVLSSVKVVGNVGYDATPSFAMTKDKEILQSILEKGLAQITTDERQALAQKWVTFPNEVKKQTFFQWLQSGNGVFILYFLFAFIVVGISILLFRRRVPAWRRFQKRSASAELHDELSELQAASQTLTGELQQVKKMEEDIESKLKQFN